MVSFQKHRGLLWLLSSLLVPLFFGPLAWETNDDVAMTMTSAGFGFVRTANSGLMFSNVVWGYIIRLIPDMFGVLGYTWALFIAMALAAVLIYFVLLHENVSQTIAGLLVFLIMLRPLSFFQFTTASGICVLGGLLGIRVGLKDKKTFIYSASIAVYLVGYLIRPLECTLLSLIALPFFFNLKGVNYRELGRTLLLIGAPILVFKGVDFFYYSTPEWMVFSRLNEVRHYFTDFGIGKILEAHPDLLKAEGYSLNDIHLLENWFFVDPAIADPAKMWRLIEGLPKETLLQWSLGIKSIRLLSRPEILPLALGALIMGLHPQLKLRREYLLAIAIGLIFIFIMGVSGRPTPIRVVYPMAALLISFGVIVLSPGREFYLGIVLGILIFFTFWQNMLIGENEKIFTHRVRQEASLLSTEKTYVVWGATLPIEGIFPPFGTDSNLRALRFYGLGVNSLNPSFLEQLRATGHEDLREWLKSKDPVPLLAHPQELKMLQTYCAERIGSPLQVLEEKMIGSAYSYLVTCQ